MKKLTAATVLVAVCLSPTVMAKKQHHDDYARVIEATPVYEDVPHRVPIQSCQIQHGHSHKPSRPAHNSLAPVIVGGVIGGTVGHAIGSNHDNKQIGLIAGSIIGATIGANINSGDSHYQHHPERDCSTTYRIEYEQVLVGYDVMYPYQGNRYHTHTKHHPGKRIRLPDEDRYHQKPRRH